MLECGYGGAYDDLKRETALLLEGSDGCIGNVVLIHLDEIGDSGTPETGFIEIWNYDPELKRAKKSGGRFVRLRISFPGVSTDICQEHISTTALSGYTGTPIHYWRRAEKQI